MSRCCLLILALTPALAAEWPQWGGGPSRNMVADLPGLPAVFGAPRPATQTQPEIPAVAIRWSARLGTQTYGTPVVAGGKVLVGTNNGAPRNPARRGDRGVLMCFDQVDGKLLWQLAVPQIPLAGDICANATGLGISSVPTVIGDRAYVVTNRCEVVALDLNGLANGNDGPFTNEATYLAKPKVHKVLETSRGPKVEFTPGPSVKLAPTDADIIWVFDMIRQVGSWPHEAPNCCILVSGDTLFVGTSNGHDRSHKNIPSPRAPTLIALDRKTGKLLAADNAGIGPKVLHGQWSSPSMGMVGGRNLVFYGGGDGYCHAFETAPVRGVLKRVWRCDANPPDSRTRKGKPLPYDRNAAGPCEIIATPVLHMGRVFVAIGQDPRHGSAKGCLTCIDPKQTGDITKTGVKWRYRGIARSLSTVAIHEGLLYAADNSGGVHCLDALTGKVRWTTKVGARVWASPLVVSGKVYIATEAGEVWVFKVGPDRKLLARNNMRAPIFATPVAANETLYIATQRTLYAIH